MFTLTDAPSTRQTGDAQIGRPKTRGIKGVLGRDLPLSAGDRGGGRLGAQRARYQREICSRGMEL